MSAVKDMFESWSNPPSIYRSAPFWSWNSQLDTDRLTRAIEGMHQAGMGGFFMHSRYGLKTPYLGEAWFKCVGACIEKAQQLGMKAYLYDEDRWPSGAAGGLVTRDHPEFRMHILRATQPDNVPPATEHVAAFSIQRDADGRLVSHQTADAAAPANSQLSFDIAQAPAGGWYNDGTYVDTMNPKAIAEFIRVTHQAYADRFQKFFGNVVPAIFTDEPNCDQATIIREEGRPPTYQLQWTAALPQEFKRRWGYDIREHLPELLFAGKDLFSKVRYDYRRTVTELFTSAFAEQIGQWCAKHSIHLTGHWLCEETLSSQCCFVGAVMPQYEFEQWPGIDILTDSAEELITAKQCSSVADQLGRERVLSELYGCTGWDWPLEGHKFVGDWQFATGVNFRCPHLTHYSLAGGAKRDYPASIFRHSPWWPYYRGVEDYFGRLSYMLTQGKPVRDVLVIHPIESAWGMYLPAARNEGQEIDRVLQAPLDRVVRTLSGQHLDWDFGDESLLSKYAKVTGQTLHVQNMAYKLVIVPTTLTLRSTTLALLKKFVKGGGKVLFAGGQPTMIDAQPAPELAEFITQCVACGDQPADILAAVEKLVPRRVSLATDGRQLDCLWAMLRTVKASEHSRASQLFFVQSHDRQAGRTVQATIEGKGPVVLWDCLTGRKFALPSQEADGKVTFALDLPATGSALVSLGLKIKDAAAIQGGQTIASLSFGGPFEIELPEPNTLNLETCCYRIGDEPFSAPVPSLKADAEIRKRFGLGTRLGGEHQPWYLYATGAVDVKPRGQCQTRRVFNVAQIPSLCKLAIEMPDRFEITVNGQKVSNVDGYWVDEDIKTIDITDKICTGENEVMLSFNYQPDMELEDLYLVGNFGVNVGEYQPASTGKDTNVRKIGKVELVAPPTTLNLGSWIGQGLDFYGGGVKYRMKVQGPQPGQRVIVRLPGVRCTAAVVHAGGKDFIMPWHPFETDITEGLVAGSNDITIQVVGGRKNVFGPLHVPWQQWTGPGEFDPENPRWTNDYLLVDHGLTSPVIVETQSSK